MAMVVAMVSACLDATAKPRPLPMPVAQDLAVEVVMNQHELVVDVPDSASAMGAQFGLIGALIGAGIENAQVKKAEERVAPIRNLLIEYPFNARIEAALRSKVASQGIAPNPVVTVLNTPWDAVEAGQDVDNMPLEAMVITPRYSMDAGFSQLTVSLLTQVVYRMVKPNGKVKTTYRFGRTYAFRFPLVSSSTEENPQRWTGMGAARLAELLDQGVEQATDMLVHDFSAEGRAAWDQKIKRDSVVLQGQIYRGRAERESQDWVWVRSGNKTMQQLQGFHPLIDAAAQVATNTDGVAQQAAPTEVPPVQAAIDEAAVLQSAPVETASTATAAIEPAAVAAPVDQPSEHTSDAVAIPADGR